jgi:tRNA-specific adenosine deaminase 3
MGCVSTWLISCSLVRKLLPDDGGLDIQHLRRFVKHENLPESLQTIASAVPIANSTSGDNDLTHTRFLIVGPTTAISQSLLSSALTTIFPTPQIWVVLVPSLPPTSQDQATFWTGRYWPTVYKKVNPFGPHFSIVSRAEAEIRNDVQKWMCLAEDVAQEASITGVGESVGAVVVERKNGIARLVAVAGDARWYDWPRTGAGNATAHATLRAIAMVATCLQLREDAKTTQTQPASIPSPSANIFREGPLGDLEQTMHNSSADADGYLCHELEIYCTHEPCVMCSMAIVHSRFGRLVFGRRMWNTGGVFADGGLGHGLFWRRELNWTLLAWQWSHDGEDSEEGRGSLLDA